MLGKLMKYEMKAVGRVMLPLYGVILAIAAVFAASIRLSMSTGARKFLEQFTVISGILFAVAVSAVFVVMALLTVQRFYRNLLGTEGYLMFTLPVTTAQNILSKLITSMIWIVAGIAVGAASGLIMIAITSSLPEFLNAISNIWEVIASGSQSQIARKVCLIVVMLLIGIAESLCKVYAAIALGHQWSDHRLLGSILAYIAFGAAEMILAGVFGINHLLAEAADSRLLWTCGIGLAGMIFYGGLAWILLERKLNLE